MFFGKKRGEASTASAVFTDIAWDDATVEWIAGSSRLDVNFTEVTATVSLGQMRADDGPRDDESRWEAYGVMTYPKFIPVRVAFDTREQQNFGGCCYDRMDNCEYRGKMVNLPVLAVWLSDQGGLRSRLLYDALRDAMLSGRKYMPARFWKKEGDGLMTEVDKEHDFSYESRYEILGMVTWPTLHPTRLPKWAVPTYYWDFSLDTFPVSIHGGPPPRYLLDEQLGLRRM